MVLKPSEIAPSSAFILADHLARRPLPPARGEYYVKRLGLGGLKVIDASRA